jgi:hypothetical protein
VKLVAAAEGGKVGLQFLDEEKYSVGFRHSLSSQIYNIGSFANIQTLDLFMAGNADTRSVTAFYSVNDGAMKQLPAQLTLRPTRRASSSPMPASRASWRNRRTMAAGST